MNEAQRNVALFRYSLIREAADDALTIRQRGVLVRELTARTHTGPAGRPVHISRGTLDRWIRAYRAGGFEALAPTSRTGEPATDKRLLDLAEALKREVPRRTAAQVTQIIATTEATGPSERTVQRHFARLGLNTRPDGSAPQAFGRFEAAAPGDLWTGDALHGPVIAGRKTYLFCFIDDYSRALVGYRFGLSEDTVRLEAAFARRSPHAACRRACYLDNGSTMVSKQLLRACASLGIRLVHSRPGKPQGRGKLSGSSRPCASSSSSRSRPGHRPTWPSSTGSSAHGSRPSITAASTQRPLRPRSSVFCPRLLRRCRPQRRSTRPSCGPKSAR